MAGICSKHQFYALECKHCNAGVSHRGFDFDVVKNHFKWYINTINMLQAQAKSIHKTHDTAETYALVQNLNNLENTFTGRYD